MSHTKAEVTAALSAYITAEGHTLLASVADSIDEQRERLDEEIEAAGDDAPPYTDAMKRGASAAMRNFAFVLRVSEITANVQLDDTPADAPYSLDQLMQALALSAPAVPS